MKKLILIPFLTLICLVQYGQIIADHTVVDKFDDIPQTYIDEVKKMWVVIAGESHSAAYRDGLAFLEALYPAYAVSVVEDGTPDPYTTSNLRASRGTWGDVDNTSGWIYGYGEEDWWTSTDAIARTKAGITHCNANGLTINAIGFGWCWDASGGWASTIDPVYNVSWYGWSEGGPEGTRPWGLDAGDEVLTDNPVNMDTYIAATQSYMDYCTSNGYSTKVFFTTGPVDNFDGYGEGEIGYQGYLKWEHIRAYVAAHPSAILFDYADILCWDDNGTRNTTVWDGHTYPTGSDANTGTEETGHISETGSIRLAKAMWWMLARLAGWNGGTTTVPVTGIAVTGAGSATTITTDNGTLQLSAAVTPSNASNKTVTWSLQNGTGQASISAAGLVTAINNGTVTARATANDGSGVFGTLTLTLSNQIVSVTGITVTGAAGATTITTSGGTLQLTAAVSPSNSDQNVTWSIQNGTGQASISTSGLVTAIANGTVTARATANDGSGVYGTLVITISNQTVVVTGITVSGAGSATTITTDNGTLQLSAAITPSNASNKTVTWSLQNGTGQASISTAGLVTAINNGTVTARATANDGSGVYGTLTLTLSNQIVSVTGITVTGAAGATTITTSGGTLQLTAAVSPSNSDQNVTWSIQNGTGQATISAAGLVTASVNGTVTARATANDGSGVYGFLVITITNQNIPVAGISVAGEGNATTISINDGTLQLYATITPVEATNKTVTWSVQNGTGQASISSTGLVTALENGTVTARATANDGSAVYGTLTITISNQSVLVTGITVSGAGNVTTIATNGGNLQLSAAITPANATNSSVTWSLQNGTGQATISSEGLVTASGNGTVIAKATAKDGSGVYGTLTITITNQNIPVAGITVTGAGNSISIESNGGTLQLTATISPANATNNTVTWSILSGTGQASISSSGLVTAISNGTVTARATANDGSSVYGTLTITISNQSILVTGITVSGSGGYTTISVNDGSLQLSAAISPSNATIQSVTWSIQNGTGEASISTTGLVTAVENGTVIAKATANDGTGVFATFTITITNQTIAVAGITVTGAAGATTISANDGTLQLSATISPADASDKSVTWSIQNGTGEASISNSGLVTAISNGTVTARATANDGSGVFGTLTITISNQTIFVTGIVVTGAGNATTISTNDGTLQLSATVTPVNASNSNVTWSVQNGTGQASISATGLVTAVTNGIVTAKATANDGSGIYGTLTIIISNQTVLVSSIIVSGTSGITTIDADNGTLQLTAQVTPVDATNSTVTWSVQSGTGLGSISTSGLLTAISNGTVTARATANDGSGIYGTLIITITNQVVPVAGISVAGQNGSSIITSQNGTLQLFAFITPANATDQSVTWSLEKVTGDASISNTGLVTASANGTVIAKATANDGSEVSGTLTITISDQITPITGITISGTGGATTITTDNGTLQILATIEPIDASDKTVVWSLENGTGSASISTTGLVTALANGTVTIKATANDGSGVTGSLLLTISNQNIPVEEIAVTGEGNASTISLNGGTLQLSATVSPFNASNKSVTWSITNGTGQASINSTGLVTAITDGTVIAKATANDGSGIYGTCTINITNQTVPVTAIIVTGQDGETIINLNDGTLQLNAAVSPANATDKDVSWTIQSGTGEATITNTGVITALTNGTVTARATANDGSGVYGILVVTITNQIVPVAGITVSASGGVTIINTNDGTLQLSADINPDDANNQTVTWSIQNGTGQASISSTGMVTAIADGSVIAKATANDGTGVYGTLTITISNQRVLVSAVMVSGTSGLNTITTNDGTLQLNATITPADATNKTVTWSIQNGTGQGTISSSGLVTAVANGTVIARATANDGSGISGTLTITISNQLVSVAGITVSGAGGATTITADNGTLQLSATLIPANAANQTVTWSVTNVTGQATIGGSGLLTALDNGTVIARATANDGSGVYGTLTITISNQVTLVSGITVSGSGGVSTITTDNGTLQLSAVVSPSNASDQSVTWSVQNGTGQASISTSGMVTALTNGTVIARAAANDGSGVYGTLTILISNQVISVAGITIRSETSSTSISNDNGTLQLSAIITPSDASNQTVTWSIENGTGQASITNSGLVTALSNGTVTARATANDGSDVYGTLTISIFNQFISVSGISVTGENGSTVVPLHGSLQLQAIILPENATNKTVIWSIQNGTGQAEINHSGLVTASANGTVTARATANDGSGVYGTINLIITDTIINIETIVVYGEGFANSITIKGGTLQLLTNVFPVNATNKNVNWSLERTARASISPSGLVTAISDGQITAVATSTDGSGISGYLNITIRNQGTITDISDAILEPVKVLLSGSTLIIQQTGDFFKQILVYNLTGYLILEKDLADDITYIDRSLLMPGIYIMVLSGSEEKKTIKLSVP